MSEAPQTISRQQFLSKSSTARELSPPQITLLLWVRGILVTFPHREFFIRL
jgi:hypothetical protein